MILGDKSRCAHVKGMNAFDTPIKLFVTPHFIILCGWGEPRQDATFQFAR